MNRTSEAVRQALEPSGIHVVELPDDASTAESAAAALRTSRACIVKSLVFRTEKGHVLVLVSGDRKVQLRLLRAELVTDHVELASPVEVRAVTGYEVGGVPPVALKTELPVYIDRHLLEQQVVYAAAGSPRAVFAVRSEQLASLTSGRLADFTA